MCTRCSQGLSGLVHGTTSAVIAAPPSSSDETRTAKNKFQIEYFRSFSLLVHCKSQISIRFCAIQAKPADPAPLRPGCHIGNRRACTHSMHELHSSCRANCYCCNNSPR
ncbi:hypothetical protein APV28_2062 [Comamonas testosteroni]|nr:hypothetical protein APV28_2062 [Comamonas testosteroni]